MKGKSIATIIMLFAAILGYLGLTFYPNVTGTITAVADAFVYQNMPNLNTGLSPYTELQSSITWQDSTPTELRYVYIMFDLSSIPTYAVVTDVRLQVYVGYVSTLDRLSGGGYKESTKGQFYGITWAETNWAESTITWSKQPSTGMPGAWHSQLFGGSYGFKSGWFTWQVGGTAERLMNHLKTDKKMAYIIFPDTQSANRPQYCDTSFINIYSREKGGGFEPKLYVDYTIPSFTLTVSVKDSDGSPIQGVSVTSPFSATTDVSGVASSKLSAGSQTVTISYKEYSYTQTILLDSDKTVSFAIPKYKLSIKVVDTQGNPLPSATISQPVSGSTDSQGMFYTRLPKGKYTVKANVGMKEDTQTVDLTADKTVTLTITAEFTLQIRVKDQVGNPLPATVTIDGQTVACDRSGVATIAVPSGTRNLQARINVGSMTFTANETFSMSKSMIKEVTITRRFYWVFYFNYTDGTVPSQGKITLTSPKETLEVPLVNGVGEAYLLDGTYVVTVEASPAVQIGTITVSQDGEVFATLNKETAKLETPTTINEVPTTSDRTPVTTPTTEVPWVLIPSVYIYTLIGVLALGFIIAGAVALRRQR
jgi:hypothetical protein